MIRTDEAALICDLAETYHIYDYRSLPLNTVAAFSVGLRENSRIKMALSGIGYSFETILLASILDNLNMRTWAMSENARTGADRPQSIVSKLLGGYGNDCGEEMKFGSVEAFEEMRKKLIGGDG